ncbi:MAG: Fur family transcriptional regulator [Candidatus Bathyarchaeia archaeon]
MWQSLEEAGVRVTPQRLAICEVILSSKEHPTADQIYEEVKKKYPAISLATVYQTSHLLSKIGLVWKVEFSDGISRFDPDPSLHIHVVCLKCRKVEDYRSESVNRLWAELVKELGFKPLGQRIDIYTYCKECSAAKHNIK